MLPPEPEPEPEPAVGADVLGADVLLPEPEPAVVGDLPGIVGETLSAAEFELVVRLECLFAGWFFWSDSVPVNG